MKNILQVSSLIVLLNGCSSNEYPAEIERKDSLVYGRSGPYKVLEYKTPYTSRQKNSATSSEISERPLAQSNTSDAYQHEDYLSDQPNKNSGLEKKTTEPLVKQKPIAQEKPAVKETAVKEEDDEDEGFDLSDIQKKEVKEAQSASIKTPAPIKEYSENKLQEDAYSSKEELKETSSKKIEPEVKNTSGYKIAHPIGNSDFSWPMQGKVTNHWDPSASEGITISAPIGTPVKSSAVGEITYVGLDEDYGNLVIIKHPNDIYTAYAYNSKVVVNEGVKVAKGQVIAYSGKTGNSTEPQLYFSIRKGSTTIDPETPL